MKTIIITGATSGIGLALTKDMAVKGYKVIMACRNTERAEVLKREIVKSTLNKNIKVVYLDLEKKSTVVNLRQYIENTNTSIDILVNNAGGFNEKYEEIHGVEKTMYVNFFATKLLTEELLPYMNENGKIINIASKAGLFGNLSPKLHKDKSFKNFKSYAASKLALIIYSDELAKKLLKTSKIKVYSVHPGAVATNIWRGTSIMIKLMAPIIRLTCKKPEEAIDTIVYLIDNNLPCGFYSDRKIIKLSGKGFNAESLKNYKKLVNSI